MREAAKSGKKRPKWGFAVRRKEALKAARNGGNQPRTGRYWLRIGYDLMDHVRKTGFPWNLPESAGMPGPCLIPFVGCVSKKPARRKRVFVEAVDITEEPLRRPVVSREEIKQRRTLADVKFFASYDCLNSERDLAYFMQIKGEPLDLIKIGYSRSPLYRAHEIQGQLLREHGLDVTLDVLAMIWGGRAVEDYLHIAFEESRVGGEWFRPTPELMALIEEAKADAIDLKGQNE